MGGFDDSEPSGRSAAVQSASLLWHFSALSDPRQRRHVVCHKVDWLFSDRRYADELNRPVFAGGPNS